MARPVHVSFINLTRVLNRAGVSFSTDVNLAADDFDTVLSMLQDGPGRANQPTEVTDTSFELNGIVVHKTP